MLTPNIHLLPLRSPTICFTPFKWTTHSIPQFVWRLGPYRRFRRLSSSRRTHNILSIQNTIEHVSQGRNHKRIQSIIAHKYSWNAPRIPKIDVGLCISTRSFVFNITNDDKIATKRNPSKRDQPNTVSTLWRVSKIELFYYNIWFYQMSKWPFVW